jgi:NADPH-dependent 2,4-dienoyl-CoA reductase/sulfur reductase-like enzyme
MPPLDPEMAFPVAERLRERGVDLRLGDGVAGFESAGGDAIRVATSSGASFETDLVLLAIGVRPEVDLARECGLERPAWT